MSKLKYYVNQNILKKVYYSLFHSKLQYCISSWGGCSETNKNSIFVLQKRAIRFLCSKSYQEPTQPLFIETRILKLADVYRLNICNIVKKMMEGKLHGNLELTYVYQKHNHNTRLRHNNFYTTSCNTNLGKSGFSYIGPKLWREVPDKYKSLSSDLFNRTYKKHLVNLYLEEGREL